MFETIVVPTDGSDYAERAADRAYEIAGHHDSSVHVICVADTGLLGSYQLPGESQSAEEVIRERASTIVAEAKELAPEGVDVRTATPFGPAKTEIIAYADSVDADLIVMGSRGRGGVERLMLGSIAEHVIRASEIDVLVRGRN